MYLYVRQTYINDFLKFALNFSGLGKALIAVVGPLTPTGEISCLAKGYTTGFFNCTFRLTLSAFLIWRMRNITNRPMDFHIGVGLWMLSAVLQFTRAFMTRFYSVYDSRVGYYCDAHISREAIIFQWLFVGFDFAIDVFVTIRLCQVLNKAINNAKNVTKNMRQPSKRSLFNSVKYWNFLRLFLAVFYHVMSVVQTTLYAAIDQLTITYIFTFIFLSLSYVITLDIDIVRVIEGRKPQNHHQKKNDIKGVHKVENNLTFTSDNNSRNSSNPQILNSSILATSTKVSSSQNNDDIDSDISVASLNENQNDVRIQI
ncbi:5684_t:CDS:2 [Ambispora gerdemannii]|uniref:5684_t:CDS:1 n=1 Tax=Ambispora gerdemannii TaxID=144530 RepID=A0A9N8WMM2_9GLOM|nr:5684_t:CDS:2 [Ambispora gerdemannii]